MSAAHRSSKSALRRGSPSAHKTAAPQVPVRNPVRRSQVASRALPDKSSKLLGRNSHRGLFGSRLPSSASSSASKSSSATDSWTSALALIEERVRGAAYDLRDAADGRRGGRDKDNGAKSLREAAEVVAGECGRLRVLILYLTGGVPLPPAERSFTERDRAGRSPAVFDNAVPQVRAPAQPVPGRS
jgi:hypothetical protein